MSQNQPNGATLGFEQTLWDAAEHKHAVLGLIFLEYISDAFTEHYQRLSLWTSDPKTDYYIKEPQARYVVLEDCDPRRSAS